MNFSLLSFTTNGIQSTASFRSVLHISALFADVFDSCKMVQHCNWLPRAWSRPSPLRLCCISSSRNRSMSIFVRTHRRARFFVHLLLSLGQRKQPRIEKCFSIYARVLMGKHVLLPSKL